jgi:hypothetical protein
MPSQNGRLSSVPSEVKGSESCFQVPSQSRQLQVSGSLDDVLIPIGISKEKCHFPPRKRSPWTDID